jgi:L-cysteine S-thiosulfotransferase
MHELRASRQRCLQGRLCERPAWAQEQTRERDVEDVRVTPLAGMVMATLVIVGDGIPQPLTDQPGDAARGRAIMVDRQKGLCLLCHSGPFPEERTQGNLSTNLAGAGSRWSTPQLRLRVADARAVQPDSLMPAFHRIQGLHRVGTVWRDKPVLDAQQLEDVVAFLASLKE